MSPLSRTALLRVPANLLLTGTVAIGLAACGSPGPFNSYDPPPTYAFRYTTNYPDYKIAYLGSRFTGIRLGDSVHPSFLATGDVWSFTGQFVVFGHWKIIEDGRWPAMWRFGVTSGCGLGDPPKDINVMTKMFGLECVPRTRPIIRAMSPSSYSSSAPPAQIDIQLDPAVVPPGTPTAVYIVGANQETLLGDTLATTDWNSSVQISAPTAPPGEYTVLVEVQMDDVEPGTAQLTITNAAQPATISLQAANGQWMVAEDGGGGIVNANRWDVGSWESFSLEDFNGGDLNDGDQIALRTVNGWYLQAYNGGGGTFLAIGGGPWSHETFTVVLLSGGDSRVDDGDYIALRSASGHYVVAEGGGGGVVNSDRGGIGSWETFRVWLR